MGEPIRVAHVVGKMVGGGVEQVVMNYYRHVDRSRVQFDFLVDADSTLVPRDEIESLGGRVFVIPPYQRVVAYQRELVRLFRRERWPIVHSHVNSLSVFPLRAAKRAGVPVRIAHSHATAGKGEPLRNTAKYFLRLFANLYPTHRLACSVYAGGWLFGKKPYEVLQNAFNVEEMRFDQKSRAAFRNRWGVSESAFAFGHAGRFAPPKNQAKLIQFFSKVIERRSDAILVFAGTGPDYDECLELAHSLGIAEKVYFIGQCEDISSFYSGIDVFLFPSTYEGLGLALVEAQASGLPCIASSSVSQEANPTGMVKFVDCEDSKAWEEEMIQAKARDDRRLSFSESSPMGRFDINRNARWLVEYYQRLL